MADAGIVNWSEELEYNLIERAQPPENSMAYLMEDSGNSIKLISDNPQPTSHNEKSNNRPKINNNNSKENLQKPKLWSSLFSKLSRGKATYSIFSPQTNIRTKNNNDLIFDIQAIKNVSINEILTILHSKIGSEVIKQRTQQKESDNAYTAPDNTEAEEKSCMDEISSYDSQETLENMIQDECTEESNYSVSKKDKYLDQFSNNSPETLNESYAEMYRDRWKEFLCLTIMSQATLQSMKLVCCELWHGPSTTTPAIWRLNIGDLQNSKIRKEVEEEIKSIESSSD
ncbi:28443_t:CDS:2 [Dentiscutata erythropus]|uniref:28443_t:CDS:1 n=1 Tax=Dentiscutata erythropus TaxID=1348616 RepID=A0A9N9AQS4_9GLOM|nr:28443_t:CDS:2 [Dentiscutata erythropus]